MASFPITNPIFKGSIRNMLNTKDSLMEMELVGVILMEFIAKHGKWELYHFAHTVAKVP